MVSDFHEKCARLGVWQREDDRLLRHKTVTKKYELLKKYWP